MEIPILLEQKEPEYTFSYSIGCYPSLWNPRLATTPLSDFDKASVIEKLKEPDELGRFQVLSIYQQSVTKTKEELAEKLRNESFVDAVIAAGGKENPRFGFDHVRRDLILIAYEETDEQDFKRRVKRKLSKKALKARNDLLETLENTAKGLIGDSLNNGPGNKRGVHENMKLYIGYGDILRRLAIHTIDKLPDMLQKDNSFIRNFYRKVQGKDYEGLREYLEETKRVVKKAKLTRDSYGLTREEFIFLEGSAENIIAFLGESPSNWWPSNN